jgi:hypothetical protein
MASLMFMAGFQHTSKISDSLGDSEALLLSADRESLLNSVTI